MLAALSGSTPTAKDIQKILSSVGVDCDAAQAKAVIDAFGSKDVAEVVAEGQFYSPSITWHCVLNHYYMYSYVKIIIQALMG